MPLTIVGFPEPDREGLLPIFSLKHNVFRCLEFNLVCWVRGLFWRDCLFPNFLRDLKKGPDMNIAAKRRKHVAVVVSPWFKINPRKDRRISVRR